MTTISAGNPSAEQLSQPRTGAISHRGIGFLIFVCIPFMLRFSGIAITFRVSALVSAQIIVGYLMLRVRSLIVSAEKLRSENKKLTPKIISSTVVDEDGEKAALESSNNKDKIDFFRHMALCTLGTALLVEIVLANTLLAIH